MDGGSESGGGGSPATVQMLQSPSSIPKPRNQHGNFDMPVFGGSQMAAAAAHMRQFSPGHSHDNSGNKRIGIPPSHPNNHQIMGSQSVSQQLGHQGLSRGPSHSRSLSQSAVFSMDSLPPLSPLPYSSSSPVNQPELVLTDVAMEDRAGVPQGMSIPSPVMGGSNVLRGSEGLPPRRGHRRSMSDSIPLAFSAMIQSSPQLMPIGSRGLFDRSFPGRENPGMEKPVELVKRESEWNRDGNGGVEAVGERKSEVDAVDDLLSAYMNLENIDTLNSSCTEDKDRDSKASGSKTNGTESSDNEVESRVKGNLNSMQATSVVEKREGLKRTASGDFVSAPRHHRSLSMDSYMENLTLDDESLKLPPPGTQMTQHSPSNSMDQSLTKFNVEFGNGEFSETELKKIMANDKLAEIAMSDPKRAKRILANRLSAARSKERKMRYISELEQKVQTLQTEATTLSAQVTVLQRDSASLTSQNNELKFRLQAMEQQAQLKDALNEALIAEVQRLRIAAAELTGNPHQQLPINHHFQLQNQQPAQRGICQQQTQAQTQAHQNNQLQSQKKNGEATTSEKKYQSS